MENLDESIKDASMMKVSVETLPSLDEQISYSDYVKLLKKGINETKELIVKYASLEKILESKKNITSEVMKKYGEKFEYFINYKRAYYGMINELFQITKKDFKKDEYYYFISENIFKKIEKEDYEKPLFAEDEKLSPEIESFYM